MHAEKFGIFRTGSLEPIAVSERLTDWAFLPNPLPPEWRPDSQKIWSLIAEARDRVASLNGAGGILPNPALLLRPLQRREAIKSNSIEGTYVSPEELLLFEAEQNQAKDPTNERRTDWREVMLYDRALSEGCLRIERGDEIDRTLICDLHRQLLQTSRGNDKQPGQFRDTQVYVEAGRRYIPPPASHLEGQIANLEQYLGNAAQSDIDPLVRAFIAHYQFEAIHPFKDGNGRIGRLLLSLCIYKWLGHSHAWLYLSEFFDKNRKEYLNKLLAISTSGEWLEWVEFCLLGTVEQANAALEKCKRLNELKRQYETQAGTKSVRMSGIISILLSNPITDAVQLGTELGISYPTARSDIEKLVACGILREMPGTRPRSYCADEIFNVAYMQD